MAGRFLYGDSEPFPGGYDFLAALQRFVAAASRGLSLTHEADELERSLGDRAHEHLQAIEAIQAFFAGVSDLVAERAARSGAPQIVGPYASQLIETIDVISQQARQNRAKELDGASVDATSHIRDRRAEIRKVVADYLLTDPLPVISWALSLSLAGTSPEGQAVLEHDGDVTTAFAIDVGRDPTWSRARRIGDISPGLALQVGFKKAFLRASLHPDVAALDELVIGMLELGPDSMELRLRRRLDAPRDSFVVTLDPDEQGGPPLVRITRFDERGGGSDAPFVSQGEEAARIIELSSMLRVEGAALIAHRKRLLSAQLDGHDVFDRGLVAVLFQRIADRLAPIAAEVSRHSPSPNELSLKLERDGGRREELYLRKADLYALVAPLPPDAQLLFHKLAFMPASAALPVPLTRVRGAGAAAVGTTTSVDSEGSGEGPSQPAPSPQPRGASVPPPPKRRW